MDTGQEVHHRDDAAVVDCDVKTRDIEPKRATIKEKTAIKPCWR